MDGTLPIRQVGHTDLHVTSVCAGTGGLGGVPDLFGDVPAERGVQTVRAVLDSPIRFLDTSANYSDGESERRIGQALAAAGGVPEGFVLATKADRDMTTGDFSGDQVRRSVEGSLERLGVDSVPLLHLHDPENMSFEEGMAPGGAVEVLLDLQRQGMARYLGVAGGPVALMAQYLRTGAFSVLITHNRWTLVDRSANDLLDEATTLGIGVINGAPYGGGILAKGPAQVEKYCYRPAEPEVLDRVRAMDAACGRAGVPLAAAALQFSIRDPRVHSTIAGFTRPERVAETVRHATMPIPDALWEELLPLAAAPDQWQW